MRHLFAWLLISSALIAMPSGAQAKIRRASPLPQEKMKYLYSSRTFIVFDWDDNVFKLPTWNALFVKGDTGPLLNRRTFLITSGELAQLKHIIGQPGTPLERFEIIGDSVDPIDGSFRFARPGKNGRNYFLEDMNRVVAPDGVLLSNVPHERKSPFYDLYIAREAKPETRAANRILTARGHLQREMHEGLVRLSEVPEVAATGYRPTDPERITLVGGTGPIHELKAQDLIHRLHEAAAKGYELFVFPDDDPLNIRRAAEVFAKIERPIPVWLIWTREHDHARIVDLTKLEVPKDAGSSKRKRALRTRDERLQTLLDQALSITAERTPRAAAHDVEMKSALLCRALFF